MKITYAFADGTKSVVDVEENWGEVILEFDRQEYNNDHKETRRHASLDAMDYEGDFFAIEDEVLTSIFTESDESIQIKEFITHLRDNEKELLEAIYSEGYTQKEYADKIGVTKGYINALHKRTLKKIKNFLETCIL